MARKSKIDIYNELDNFVEENEGEVTHTEIARHFYELGRNNAIEEACEWLEKKACLYVWKNCEQGEHGIHKTMLEDFRKAMKGGEKLDADNVWLQNYLSNVICFVNQFKKDFGL